MSVITKFKDINIEDTAKKTMQTVLTVGLSVPGLCAAASVECGQKAMKDWKNTAGKIKNPSELNKEDFKKIGCGVGAIILGAAATRLGMGAAVFGAVSYLMTKEKE